MTTEKKTYRKKINQKKQINFLDRLKKTAWCLIAEALRSIYYHAVQWIPYNTFPTTHQSTTYYYTSLRTTSHQNEIEHTNMIAHYSPLQCTTTEHNTQPRFLTFPDFFTSVAQCSAHQCPVHPLSSASAQSSKNITPRVAQRPIAQFYHDRSVTGRKHL